MFDLLTLTETCINYRPTRLISLRPPVPILPVVRADKVQSIIAIEYRFVDVAIVLTDVEGLDHRLVNADYCSVVRHMVVLLCLYVVS